MRKAKQSGGVAAGATRGGVVLAVLVFLALAAPLSPASAGQDPGIRIGYYSGADADDPVPVIGVYGRLDIPGPLNLEISADYRQEALRGGDLEATVIPVRVSVVASFLPVVSPYLLAGVGADYVGIDFRNEFAGTSGDSSLVLEFHAGAGVEFSLGPLSLIGDLRYCGVGAVSSESVRRALGHDYDPSGWYASISAGISF
jgi:opacity protein-like surface antigen